MATTNTSRLTYPHLYDESAACEVVSESATAQALLWLEEHVTQHGQYDCGVWRVSQLY